MYGIRFHADDFAASVENSKRILSLMEAGRLDSVSVMTNMGCYSLCVKMLRERWESLPKKPLLTVHLNLIDGFRLSSSDSKEIIHHSWTGLFFRGLLPGKKRRLLQKACSAEIEAQIRAFQRETEGLLDEEGKPLALRMDSHVHTFMIPMVFSALMDALDRMNLMEQVRFIRCSTEPLLIFFSTPGVMGTVPPVNILKNLILHALSHRVRKELENRGIGTGYVFGIALTGEMDVRRVNLLMPKVKRYAQKKDIWMEVLSHPGRSAAAELTEEYGPEDRKAFISAKRDEEYRMLMEHQPV